MLEPVTVPIDVDPASNRVVENAPNGSIVGLTFFAIDPDSGPNAVTYSLVDDAGGRFWIHPALGGIFVSNGAIIDRETAASYSITVLASSVDGSTRTATYTIDVADLNEPPVIEVSNQVTSLPENSPTPRTIATIAIRDDALGSNTVNLAGTDAAFFELVGGAVAIEARSRPRFRDEVDLLGHDQRR